MDLALNESPSEKEGKYNTRLLIGQQTETLNESPSEKEGKSIRLKLSHRRDTALNESPSEKEGKWNSGNAESSSSLRPSMKVPPKRKGNGGAALGLLYSLKPSMKVPPKRKGNLNQLSEENG